MKDCLEIGSTPASEDCQQVGMPSYDRTIARKETLVFANQIVRQFGIPPQGAEVVVKNFTHDFGTYLEVCILFDDDYPESVEYAFNVEANVPEFWDNEAKNELTRFLQHYNRESE